MMKIVKTRRNAKKSMKRKPLKVGDRVALKWGDQKVRALVIEDRGALGVGGRQIVRLRLLSAVPGSEFELPAEMVMP